MERDDYSVLVICLIWSVCCFYCYSHDQQKHETSTC